MMLQPPQWFTLPLVLVSQPLAVLPSQFPYPVLQAIPHCPLLQDAVPFAEPQMNPQDPQLSGSPPVLVSHPVVWLLSQFVQPVLHEPMTQVPLEQAAVACGMLQAIGQEPQ
jgi:hypothetical protein